RFSIAKYIKSTLIVLVPAVLIELYFFYKNGFIMSELFFFVWFLIFGTFFSFRWMGGNASLMGIGGNSARFLASKFSESMYPDNNADKFKGTYFSMDLIFVILAIVNLLLSFVAYYMAK
ncbi:MAG TPA: hypothetical protein DCG34_13310, partial [Clostridiales bacterium]|nr:hypothetical protein [Clostridiales bacterium]